METTILLIRHGETSWNRKKIFRGTHDVPLNNNGLKQTELLAKSIRSRSLDFAYSSPLKRAAETASIVLEGRNITFEKDDGLLDFNFGKWTGLSEKEVSEKWTEEYHLWKTQPESLRVPGGNTLQEVYDTAYQAMEALVFANKGKTIALFSHRVVNKLLVLATLGLGVKRFPYIRQDNCCLNELKKNDSGYVIYTLNNTCHLIQGNVDVLQADF